MNKQVPKVFKGMSKRQSLQGALVKQHGSLGAAMEAITGVAFSADPEEAKKDEENCKGFRRFTSKSDDAFEASGSIVHVWDGTVSKRGNFFGMLAAFYGYDGFSNDEEGFKIALDHILDRGFDFQVSVQERELWKARKLEKEKASQLKADKNKASGVALYERKLPDSEAAKIYESYMSQGRGIECFDGLEVSAHVCVVKDLPYYYKRDTAQNNGRKFTVMLFPYTKRQNDGTYKIFGLHAIYLEQEGGHYVKANVLMPKQDLPSWSSEPGVAHNLWVAGNEVLFVGEGNETVSAYYAAMRDRYADSLKADFRFTNTASRLGGVSGDDYSVINLLVDRDKSGTGMTQCMKARHRLLAEGKQVNLILPPSSRLPVYIYFKPHSDFASLEECIKEAKYWRSVDEAFAKQAKIDGDVYSSRYTSYVVIPDNYHGDFDYPHIIRLSHVPKEQPKSVDWDDVIKHSPDFAHELFDYFLQLEIKHAA